MVSAALLSPIVLFPLFGAILSYLVGRKFKPLAGIIATVASGLSFLWVLKMASTLGHSDILIDDIFEWMSVGSLSVGFSFRLDALSMVMCLVVTGVGSLIHLYSTAYMAEDEGRHRFFAYLNLFMFSMLLLVLGSNLLVLFVGWEGVGLCSYLLIGFWFKNLSFAAAGRKAFVVNRIGDAGFIVGMFLLFRAFGTLDFASLQAAINSAQGMTSELSLAAFCLFIGATGKSAQIPLFVWLPDAMAGPTPVSALIHAATMVTAGVYLMARMNFLFVVAPTVMALIFIIAVLTALVAALIALTQYDIKKVLAYSTVSQLGFMFMAAGSGAFWVAIFHVVTHAFFKACLFLGAGSVIHGCHHEQDMRHMGGLFKKMPITAATYLISVLAISGIFFFSGYQSKHAILFAIEHQDNQLIAAQLTWLFPIIKLVTFLTAFYMTRSFAMTFLGKYRGHAHPHESPWQMSSVLLVLGVLAAIGGVALDGSFGFSLQHYLSAIVPIEGHHAHETILEALAHSWIGILGVIMGILFYTKFAELPGRVASAFGPITSASRGKFYVDEIYGALIVRPLENLARGLWKEVDQGVVDATVNGTATLIDTSAEIRKLIQTGQLRFYLFCIFGATALLLIFYLV